SWLFWLSVVFYWQPVHAQALSQKPQEPLRQLAVAAVEVQEAARAALFTWMRPTLYRNASIFPKGRKLRLSMMSRFYISLQTGTGLMILPNYLCNQECLQSTMSTSAEVVPILVHLIQRASS